VQGPFQARAVHREDIGQPLRAEAQLREHLVPVVELGIVCFQLFDLLCKLLDPAFQSAALAPKVADLDVKRVAHR
jgi:hypothetical protein